MAITHRRITNTPKRQINPLFFGGSVGRGCVFGMTTGNIQASRARSTRNTSFVGCADCDADIEKFKKNYESYEDRQKRLKELGL